MSEMTFMFFLPLALKPWNALDSMSMSQCSQQWHTVYGLSDLQDKDNQIKTSPKLKLKIPLTKQIQSSLIKVAVLEDINKNWTWKTNIITAKHLVMSNAQPLKKIRPWHTLKVAYNSVGKPQTWQHCTAWPTKHTALHFLHGCPRGICIRPLNILSTKLFSSLKCMYSFFFAVLTACNCTQINQFYLHLYEVSLSLWYIYI